MRMAYFLFTICALLALFAQFAQARPGPGMLSDVGTGRTLLDFSDEPQAARTEIVNLSAEGKTETEDLPAHEKVDEDVQQKPSDTEFESAKTEEAEEDEVVCTEMGTCYEKRLLTATIDYKNDGPNNPITDPPH